MGFAGARVDPPARQRGHTAARSVPSFGFCVWGFGRRFRVSGSGFRFYRVQNFGVGDSCSVFRVSCLGFRISGFGVRDSGFFFRVSGFVFRVPCFRDRVSRFGVRVSGSLFRGSCFVFRDSGLESTGAPDATWDATPALGALSAGIGAVGFAGDGGAIFENVGAIGDWLRRGLRVEKDVAGLGAL